jgi:hypothetical protein
VRERSFHGRVCYLGCNRGFRLTRSFDQRSHTYLGYALNVRGRVGNEARDFLVGVGQGAHAKHQFCAGTALSGDALPVLDGQLETVEFYQVSKLRVGPSETEDEVPPPPWHGVPPPPWHGVPPPLAV